MQSRGLGIDACHHLLFVDDHKLVLKTREPGVIGNTLSLVVADVPRGLEKEFVRLRPIENQVRFLGFPPVQNREVS